MRLLSARMEQANAFMNLQLVGNLSLRFELRRDPGRTRTLDYVLGGLEKLRHGRTPAVTRRLSTLALPGAAGNFPADHFGAEWLRRMVPICSCHVTIIAAEHECEILAGIGPLGPRWQLPYHVGDTLTGRRARRLNGAVSTRPRHRDKLKLLAAGEEEVASHGETASASVAEGFLVVFCVDICT